LLGEDNMFKKFSVKKILKRYKKFPLLSLPADLLSTVTTWCPNIFMNRFFGSEYTGYFSMTEKVLGSPIWFITSSVGDVFKQEASEQYREKGTCLPIFKKTTKSLFFLGIIPFAIIFIIAPYAVPFLLGDAWEPVGKYIRILSFMYFVRFVVNPVAYVIYIVEKQNWAIIFQTIMALCTVGSFFLGWYMQDIYITFWSWVISSSIVNIGLYFLLYKLASRTKNVSNPEK
jgi:O-antigen/teichoic acid export membrane protein